MSPREVRCTCGAINDVTFGTCIRCGAKLSAEGQAEAARVRVPEQPRVRISTRGADEAAPSYGTSTLVLGGLCSLVFALQLMLALKRGGPIPLLSSGEGADAMRVGALYTADVIVRAEPFRVLSCVFVHFGIIHFALNMLSLGSLARASNGLVGTTRTIITFLATGIAGNLVTLGYQLLAGSAPTLTAGASGGVLGVMGLLIGVLVRRGNGAWKRLLGNTIVMLLVISVAVNSAGAGINHAAHLGGMAAGFLFGLAWSRSGPVDTTPTRVVAGLMLLASVASIVLSATSPLPNMIEGR